MKGDVLITGATGLIGGEIGWRLMKAGWRVWCIVRAKSLSEAAARLERRFAISGQRCQWPRLVALPGDVTAEWLGMDFNAVAHLRQQCSHIIHCAADTSFATQNRCAAVNSVGTQNIVELCRSFGSRVRLFHMSSAVTCLKSGRGIIHEHDAPAGFSNDYVLSKRNCEERVLNSTMNAVVLRPTIVLSHGINSRDFARSMLWVLPVIRRLGVLPMSGHEPLDVVSVRFVAEAVTRMLTRELRHRIYHISAGQQASVTWAELLQKLTEEGRDYGAVRFEAGVDWASVGLSDPGLRRCKEMVNHYLPFMRAGAVYDSSRLRQQLGADFPSCPKVTEYCDELLELFVERDAFEAAKTP